MAPAALWFDLPVMLAVAVACLPVFLTGFTISRAEGALLLGYYVAYVAYLSLDASGHAAEGVVGAGLLWFALPLTALGLGLTTWRVLRPSRA